MIESILDSVKKVLGLAPDYAAFDEDVIMHINTAFSTLNQLGVGPLDGFMIEDNEPIWDTFLEGDPRLNHIKSYVNLRVRMLFDPPNTGYLVEAMNKQVEQLEWRINVQREDSEWIPPVALSTMDE